MKARFFWTLVAGAVFGLIVASLPGTGFSDSYTTSSMPGVVFLLLFLLGLLFGHAEDDNLLYVTVTSGTLHLICILVFASSFDSFVSSIGTGVCAFAVFVGFVGSLDLLLNYVRSKDGSEPIWPDMVDAPVVPWVKTLEQVQVAANADPRPRKFSEKTSPWWHVFAAHQFA